MLMQYKRGARTLLVLGALSALAACGGESGLGKSCESGEELVDGDCVVPEEGSEDEGSLGDGELDDGSGEVSDGDSDSAGKVSGYIHDGRVKDAKVEIYTLDSGDTSGSDVPGELVTETRADSNGYYEAKVVGSGPMVVRATAGRYTEDASGEEIKMATGERLSAPVYYNGDNGATAHLTYYSHLTTGLTRFLVDVQATEPVNAIPLARDRVHNWIGVNPVTTRPARVAEGAESADSISPALRYGYLTAAISAWTKRIAEKQGKTVHDEIDSIGFAQVAYDDIRGNGELDGQGQDGATVYGEEPLNTDKMRVNALGWGLRFVASDRNKAGLGFETMKPVLDTITRNDSRIFPGGEPPALSSLFEKPDAGIQGTCPATEGGTTTVTADFTGAGFPMKRAQFRAEWWRDLDHINQERSMDIEGPGNTESWNFDVPSHENTTTTDEDLTLRFTVTLTDGFGRKVTDTLTCSNVTSPGQEQQA